MSRRQVFDEVYPINDSYRRFDQRNSAFGRNIKKTGRIVGFGEEDKIKRIKMNLPGYTLVDYAFNAAAGMYETIPGEQDSQGTGFYSWSSLGIARRPEEVPRWEGTPEKTAKIMGNRWAWSSGTPILTRAGAAPMATSM